MPRSSEDLDEVALAWFRMQAKNGTIPALSRLAERARQGDYEAHSLLVEQVLAGNLPVTNWLLEMAKRDVDDLVLSLLKELERQGNQLILTQLVELARKGDPRAYAALYRYYYTLIYALLYGMLANREEAEDLAHDTFINAWKALTQQQKEKSNWKESKNSLNSPSSFKPWLMTIARNKAKDFLHRKKIIAWLSLDFLGVSGMTLDQPSGDIEHILQVIKKLPERQRECLILHIHGYNNREVAQILTINEKNVAVNIYLAKLRLRKDLKGLDDE